MNNLDRYVEEKKIELKEKSITNELEIIRYIYLDLGKRFSFDERFIPFGNSKTKQRIYKFQSRNINDLNECMNNRKIICKSLSYILEYILSRFDINIQTIVDNCEHINCPHVYNFIKCKDGRKFCLDLQEDINNIQTHSFTSNFGFESPFSNKFIINRKEQESLDRKLGYIDDNNYYFDDYLYLLHSITDGIDDFKEKVEFILENMDIIDTSNMGYTDRQWHHRNVLESFFNTKEFDYQTNSGKIRMYDCYKDINGVRKYYNFILVMDKNDVEIYSYNKNENKYKRIDKENYINCMINGLKVHNGKMPFVKRKVVY